MDKKTNQEKINEAKVNEILELLKGFTAYEAQKIVMLVYKDVPKKCKL